jgi:hypothetical protein
MTARAGDNGTIVIVAAANGIEYCYENGAKVISLSYGGIYWSTLEQTAIANAWATGVAVFAAAGNEGTSAIQYPAGYPDVEAVAATNSNNQITSFSSFGDWVDLCAPGEGIWGTIPNSGYGNWSGTSFSCPITAGLACLLLAAHPSFDNQSLIDYIELTCDNIDLQNPGYIGQMGAGRINAGTAISGLFPVLEVIETDFTDPTGNNDGRPDPGETVNLLFTMENSSFLTDGVNVQVDLTCDDPSITITQGSITFPVIGFGSTVNNNSNPFTFTVDALAPVHEATFVLTATESTLLTSPVFEIVQMIGRPDYLIVDDDGGSNYQQFYSTDLDCLDTIHDVWNANALGDISQEEMMLYHTMIWHTSAADNPLTQGEQDLIAYYLSHGGQLVLAGEDIDEQLRGTPFYADVLHCVSQEVNGIPQLTGVEGDPISDGTTLTLVGSGGAGNNQSPAGILPGSGASQIYTYNTTPARGAALRWDGLGGQLVYFAFNFEAASGLNSTDRYEIMANIIEWFDQVGIETVYSPTLPDEYALDQNYPNPFNPSTEIAFALPQAGPVRLAIYDLAGRLVEELANQTLPAGEHKVTYAAKNAPSGIYICRLDAGSSSFSRKMILLK